MQPLSGNQRPDLLTSLMNMSFVLRLPRKMHLCRSSSNAPRLPWFLEMRQNPHVLLTFDKVHKPLRLPGETTSEPPKVSKSGAGMWCFVHFGFEMCFGPQRRALVRHLNFQVVRPWCALYVLTSICPYCQKFDSQTSVQWCDGAVQCTIVPICCTSVPQCTHRTAPKKLLPKRVFLLPKLPFLLTKKRFFANKKWCSGPRCSGTVDWYPGTLVGYKSVDMYH